MSPSRLTFEDFQQLLSVVGVKSLREEDPQLISLLSMRATWFLSLFPWVSVIIFLPVFDFGWYVIELGNETVWRLGHLKTWWVIEMKRKNKTKQNKKPRARNYQTKKYGTVWCKNKNKMISERFEGRAILAARITSEFKMAVMLSSNTLLTCSVIVLLRRIDFTSSRLFIWPAMFDLKLAWTGKGAGKKILSTRFGLFLII